MGLVDDIKKEAVKTGVKIQSSDISRLEELMGKMFYLPRRVEEETRFIKLVMTRGLESSERRGLHASAMIVPEKKFCLRQQVLSLHYKQLQGQQLPESLLRIFEEGNAIHEKWQRLFIRAKYAKPEWLDRTRFDEESGVSYSPDIECYIPEFYPGRMIGEIKSVNTFQFKKMDRHPSAWKQLQFYLYLCQKEAGTFEDDDLPDYKKGFVLCEDKNTQEYKLELYDFDYDFVKPFIDRLDEVAQQDGWFLMSKKPPARNIVCTDPECKMAASCPMRDCCWNIGEGRVRL